MAMPQKSFELLCCEVQRGLTDLSAAFQVALESKKQKCLMVSTV